MDDELHWSYHGRQRAKRRVASGVEAQRIRPIAPGRSRSEKRPNGQRRLDSGPFRAPSAGVFHSRLANTGPPGLTSAPRGRLDSAVSPKPFPRGTRCKLEGDADGTFNSNKTVIGFVIK
jgi:hypothetical protein